MAKVSRQFDAFQIATESDDAALVVSAKAVEAKPAPEPLPAVERIRVVSGDRGQRGKRGRPGKDGEDGEPGRDAVAKDGADGEDGEPGDNGWTPVISNIPDGTRVVQFLDYRDGQGTKPPIGYITEEGLTSDPKEATNIRGLRGRDGKPGGKGKAGVGISSIVHVESDTAPTIEGDSGFDFTQSSPAAIWTIAHNLGRLPIVTVRTVGGVEMEGLVTNLSVNTLQVDFNTAVAGTARLI